MIAYKNGVFYGKRPVERTKIVIIQGSRNQRHTAAGWGTQRLWSISDVAGCWNSAKYNNNNTIILLWNNEWPGPRATHEFYNNWMILSVVRSEESARNNNWLGLQRTIWTDEWYRRRWHVGTRALYKVQYISWPSFTCLTLWHNDELNYPCTFYYYEYIYFNVYR